MKGHDKSPDERLELHGSNPKQCPDAALDHSDDGEMCANSWIDDPIEVPVLRGGKYVNWEYSHIDKAGVFHRCLQQLLRFKEGKRELDRIVVRDYGGQHYVFYFDITEAMKVRGQEMEKAYEDHKAGRRIDPRDLKALKGAEEIKRRAARRSN